MENANKTEPLLRAEHITKYFGNGKNSFQALDDVSIEVNRGEAFGLVGESGCGKTTFGRVMIGLYEPTHGRIYFDGELIAEGSTKQKKRRRDKAVISRMQMIFQDPSASLDSRMTVRDTVAEGLVISGEKRREVIDKRVAEMLSYVGMLPEHGSRYPHEFSGGQRQRIGIARALIMKPELIIADEPISALDVSVRAQIMSLLAKLKTEFGTAILFVAHDLSVVKYFCDRVGVMYRGRLMEVAESKELFSNPIHPYTRALLSAVPRPDPLAEKTRKREIYVDAGDVGEERCMRETVKGHYVFSGERELDEWRKMT